MQPSTNQMAVNSQIGFGMSLKLVTEYCCNIGVSK
jgi:hypothetical protein